MAKLPLYFLLTQGVLLLFSHKWCIISLGENCDLNSYLRILFNALPAVLRPHNNLLNFDQWKILLDKFLATIPDNPVTGPNESGLCDYYSSKQTNSLLFWIPHLGKSGRRGNIDVSFN